MKSKLQTEETLLKTHEDLSASKAKKKTENISNTAVSRQTKNSLGFLNVYFYEWFKEKETSVKNSSYFRLSNWVR